MLGKSLPQISLLPLPLSLLLLLGQGCGPSPVYVEPTLAWSDSLLQTLTLEQKVGQMIMLDMPAPGDITTRVTRDAIATKIQEVQAGGLLIFAGHPLSHSIWNEWAQQQSAIPLMIALDAEWGPGYRLAEMTRYPNAMSIGATTNAQYAFEIGKETARQASFVGVNVLFAPIADVNTNPANPVIGTRAYSDDPDSVFRYASAFIRGVRAGGLISVAKHFPGHGSTSRDSHLNLPVAERDSSSFMEIDVKPYRNLISDSLDAIMTAHVVAKGHGYADSVAATFSKRIITDLARDSLGFDGIIFTDALNMAGATTRRTGDAIATGDEIALAAVIAGVDVLLMPPDARSVQLAIIGAVRSGLILESRIDASVRRILRAKESAHLPNRSRFTDYGSILKTITGDSEEREALFIARDAVTVLKDDSVLPLSGMRSDVLLLSVNFRSYTDPQKDPANKLMQFVEQRSGGTVSHIRINPRNWKLAMPSAVTEARNVHTVLFADFTGITPVFGWNRADMLADLSDATNRMAYLNFDSPYAISELQDAVDAIVLGYDSSPAMMEAVADAVFGLSSVGGRLPVRISDQYPRGTGLRLPQRVTSEGSAEKAGMDPATLSKLDRVLRAAIADSAFASAAIAIGRNQTVAKMSAIGSHTFSREQRLAKNDLFDLASLTKVVATTTAIMQLYERGDIDLRRPVSDYLPAFGQNGKGAVTIWQLLTHTGGLIPFRPFHMQGVRSASEVRSRILEDSLVYEPGSESRYSDFGPITLAWMIESVTGERFDDYARTHIFEPLSMYDTRFLEVRQGALPNVVPTETDDYFRNRTLQGEVHDETAYLLGGTAGHAGLFSTASDLARFAGMLTADGRIGDRVFLKPETVRLFTQRVDIENRDTRALGWDTRSQTGYSSSGSFFGPRSFGHTGFTGTSMWIDPDSKLFVILLTNRVYPTRKNRKHIPLRPAVADVAFEAFRRSVLQDLHLVE